MDKQVLVQQTSLAFDFLQKLYLEVSYLIKEIEGMLSEEEEHFLIGKGSGYAVTARSSNGLEAYNVHLWPLRTFSVFFVPDTYTKAKGGVTDSGFVDGLKTIFIKVFLDSNEITEPYVYIGTMFDMSSKKEKYPKFENLITSIEYNYKKIFTDDTIEYEDANFKFKGKFFRVNLFDINSGEDIRRLIMEPALRIFRNIN